jgi:hypothetical protein
LKSDDLQEQKRATEGMLDLANQLDADYLKYFGSRPPGHIWPRSVKSTQYETAFRSLEAMSRKQSQL